MRERESSFFAAGYIRLSREDGDKAESDSVGNQRRLIQEYLKDRENFELYDFYVDDGFTGTNYSRPAFLRMLADIEAARVNCVIVKDLSRLGRDYIDTGRYLERYFPEKNVRFVSVADGIDSFRRAYDMLLPIKNIFNEQYARDISQKVHVSMETKQRAGEFIGAFASYGYRKSAVDKNRLVIDEYAAGVVRRIFRLYTQGHGKLEIASALNREGIVCPSEYKKLNGENYRNGSRFEENCRWTYSTVNRILGNEMYIGNMVQGRKSQSMRGKPRARGKEEWIVVKGTHEAVVDPETWERAQKLLGHRTRSPGGGGEKSIFAGFLKCGDCGRSLVKKGRTDCVRYYCGTYVRCGRQSCAPHAVSHEVLEKIVLEDLNAVMTGAGNLRRSAEKILSAAPSAQRNQSGEERRLKAELDRVRLLKKAVYEDFRCELLTREEFDAYSQDYQKREELLKRQLESDRFRRGTAEGESGGSPWVRRLLELGRVEALDRDTVTEMIHEIRVYENRRIRIVYNFSGELFPKPDGDTAAE